VGLKVILEEMGETFQGALNRAVDGISKLAAEVGGVPQVKAAAAATSGGDSGAVRGGGGGGDKDDDVEAGYRTPSPIGGNTPSPLSSSPSQVASPNTVDGAVGSYNKVLSGDDEQHEVLLS